MSEFLPIPEKLVGYTGNKSQAGVYQFIINHVPAHKLRIECFLGSGIISSRLGNSRHEVIIGGDADHLIIDQWQLDKSCQWIMTFPMSYERLIEQCEKYYKEHDHTFIYADPPYLKETRSNEYDLYRKEFEKVDHINFLTRMKFQPQNVMISHYPCELYNDMLSGWIKKEFTSQTRGGPKTDAIYMNYDIKKLKLHSTKFLGESFTKRQMLSRKIDRWQKAFNRMTPHERQAVIESLTDNIR